MDNTIRKNEKCIIGLPRCDFVFSSTRTCFIAYGFEESPLEMNIIRKLLEERGIQAEEAGGSLAPAQSAFCAKICSKIITSQFCIVLLNNQPKDNIEIPNANVNMEYGLMLGFNKYVIPFQLESQKLPFNVAGLDTVKYTNEKFMQSASSAIDQAIKETQQDELPPIDKDQVTATFLFTKSAMYTPLDSEGEKNLFNIGSPLGYNLLNDFSGMRYMFLGSFTSLRPEAILWRLKILGEIIDGRRQSMSARGEAGIATEEQLELVEKVMSTIEIWVIVTSEDDKKAIINAFEKSKFNYDVHVYSMSDVKTDLEKLD